MHYKSKTEECIRQFYVEVLRFYVKCSISIISDTVVHCICSCIIQVNNFWAKGLEIHLCYVPCSKGNCKSLVYTYIF